MSDTVHSPAPKARDDVLFRRVGDDWLLFDPLTQDVHVLNLTAALVWAHCDGDHDPNAIRAAVEEAYPVAEGPDATEREGAVREALASFRELGLLTE